MKRIGVIFIVYLLIIINCIPFNASATTKSGTITINQDEFHSWKITLPNVCKLKYQISVTGYPMLIDVFLFNITNYNNYRNNMDFEYDLNGSAPSSCGVRKNIMLEPGTYYLVVDNTDLGLGSPTLIEGESYPAEINYWIWYPSAEKDSSAKEEFSSLFISILIVIIIIEIVVVLAIWKSAAVLAIWKREGKTEPYQQSQARYCSNCNKQIPNDGIFCPYCGNKED